jgi:hypothetical protein
LRRRSDQKLSGSANDSVPGAVVANVSDLAVSRAPDSR